MPASFGRVAVNIPLDLSGKHGGRTVKQRARDSETHDLPLTHDKRERALPRWLAVVDGARVGDNDAEVTVRSGPVRGIPELLYVQRFVPAQKPPASND